MSSKPKTKTFIVHHRGRTKNGGCIILGGYLVSARNEKEAEKLLRESIGKHTKVITKYEAKENTLLYGIIIKINGGTILCKM
jgi:hypothetical protein